MVYKMIIGVACFQIDTHTDMEGADALLAPLRAHAPPFSPAALTELTAHARALRAAAAAGAPASQAALLAAGAPQLLAALLTGEALRSAPSAPAPLFRRVLWQALANLCAGHCAGQAAVWAAVAAPAPGGGCCALECGATAAASDAALASVVLGVAYTAGASACYGGEGGGGGGGASADSSAAQQRLAALCLHPVLLPTLLRPCLPAMGGAAGEGEGGEGGAPAHAGDVAQWCQLLAGALVQGGHLAEALRAASRGLAAGELLLQQGSASAPPQQRAWRVTAESTALVCAAEAELEGAGAAQARRLAPGLAAAVPALGHLLTDACTQALAMAGLCTGSSSGGGGGGGGGELDSGPLLLLPRLQLGLCLRAAEAAAGLLADALSAKEGLREDGEAGEVREAGEAGEAGEAPAGESDGLPSGTVTAVLGLLAAATPLISAAGVEQPLPAAGEAGSGAAAVEAEALPPPPPSAAPSAAPPPAIAALLSPAAALFAARLPPPPPPALRTALVRALAHAMHGGPGSSGEGARREALAAGGVPVVLAQTKMDASSITTREWTLLALKHWCEAAGEGGALARAAVQAVREGAAGGVARELPPGIA